MDAASAGSADKILALLSIAIRAMCSNRDKPPGRRFVPDISLVKTYCRRSWVYPPAAPFCFPTACLPPWKAWETWESQSGVALGIHGQRPWKNTTEGMWTGLRNFLLPFRGMHMIYLSGCVAVQERRVNFKRVSSAFTSAHVQFHSFHS